MTSSIPRSPRRHPLEVSATPEAIAVREAVKAAGGSVVVGEALGRAHQAVQKWMAEPQRMRARFARQLCRLAGYKVPLVRLQPDIYGDLSVRELGYQPPLEPQA